MKDPNALMHTFLMECRACRRKHRMHNAKCTSCGVYVIPMPFSEKVLEDCWATYECDGCEAYRDHLR